MNTRLASISGHHLSVECACGRHELVPVAELVAAHGDLTLAATRRRLRCSRCGQRQIKELRIIHVGGSWGATQGARRD